MKQLTLVAAGAIASRVSGLSVVASKSTDAEKKDYFSSGRMASGHLPLVHTHARTNGQNFLCNLTVMMIIYRFHMYIVHDTCMTLSLLHWLLVYVMVFLIQMEKYQW